MADAAEDADIDTALLAILAADPLAAGRPGDRLTAEGTELWAGR